MTDERGGARKGYIIKLFGVVVIFLGLLDAMLAWRGGLPSDTFYVWLVGAGLILYVGGAIRSRQNDDLQPE